MSFIIDCQLFPSIEYFKIIGFETDVVIDKYDRFVKTSFRNRYVIATANGLLHLTVPIEGGREQKILMKDVVVDDHNNWRTKHWRSITSAYRKAPFFDYYEQDLKDLIFSPEKSLLEWNVLILNKICNLLSISQLVVFAEKYDAFPAGIDYRNKILPNNFQNENAGWQPRYPQVFEDRIGFQANLSILDLLFCQGPNSRHLLKNSLPPD